MPSPSLPHPHITPLQILARSIDIAWSYPPDQEPSGDITYQVSRRQEDDWTWVPVYEGPGTRTEVGDLIPETTYRVRLRVKIEGNDSVVGGDVRLEEDGWSVGEEVEFKTTGTDHQFWSFVKG